jgi:hypothetical protein
MAKFQWVRVSKQSPCPICEKDHYCSVSADGTIAKCMFQEAGAFKSKEDKNGVPYHLHRVADRPRFQVDPPQPPGPEAKRADSDTLHLVYSALLDRLTLTNAHREALHGRGLANDTIDRAGYRTLPGQRRPHIARELHERFGDKLLRVPGFVVKEGPSGRYLTLRGPAGLIVPCRDRAGRIVALKVRRDDVGAGGPRYCYISSAGHGGPGSGAPVHVPAGTPQEAELVRVTEGELKADIIQARTGLPTVSVPGAGSWRHSLAVLKSLSCKTARLAFDADGCDNATVARNLSSFADALLVAGFALQLERWNAADGKGLDDLLAAGKVPELLVGDAALQAVREILAASSADEEPGPPEELTRLQDVLDAGGAEALFRDKALMQALADLAGSDPTAFAAVRASIRQRVSLRDLDRALQPFRQHTRQPDGEDAPVYFEADGYTYRNAQTKEGPIRLALCNFTARIVEEVLHDDGVEQTLRLAVQGALADKSILPRAEISASDFAGMGWVVPAWGTRAVVFAGMGTKDHFRTALQLLSGDVPRRTVFRHIGWRKIGEGWVYLHAGGAIGADGQINGMPVLLPEPLIGFCLPPPVEGPELADAVRASLGLLHLGPERLTFPLLAAVYRAVLGETDFALHLTGPTSSFKTEAAALAQQHYGPGMDARHLPANWSSTGNALEALAFTAKDALLVIDDFCPTGSTTDVQRQHKEADRLFRGQGNRAGRQRMGADSSLRPTKAARGLVTSTGEDTPRGQSLRARMLVLEISPGDFGPPPPELNPRLSAYQQVAAAGKYATALAGFIRWLASQYGKIRNRLRQEQVGLREQATAEGQHARTPGIIADLALGLRYLLNFAQSVGAISETEGADLYKRGWAALAEAAAAQAGHIGSGEPAGLFVRLLSAAIASGRAYVAGPEGLAPKEAERWGWRRRSSGPSEEWQPQGYQIGWVDGQDLYLEPDAAYAAAQELAREQGDSFPVTAQTLRKRLREKGYLASVDAQRQKLTVRRTLQGSRRDVLHLSSALCSPLQATGPTGPEAANPQRNGPVSGAGSGGKNEEPAQQPPHESAQKNGENDELGRLGQRDAHKQATPGENVDKQQANDWGNWQ